MLTNVTYLLLYTTYYAQKLHFKCFLANKKTFNINSCNFHKEAVLLT